VRRGIYGYWFVLSQPDHPGSSCIRMGMDQLPASTGVEKDQHHSLPAFIVAGAGAGRPFRDADRANASLHIHSGFDNRYSDSADHSELSDTTDGNPVRRGVAPVSL